MLVKCILQNESIVITLPEAHPSCINILVVEENTYRSVMELLYKVKTLAYYQFMEADTLLHLI